MSVSLRKRARFDGFFFVLRMPVVCRSVGLVFCTRFVFWKDAIERYALFKIVVWSKVRLGLVIIQYERGVTGSNNV